MRYLLILILMCSAAWGERFDGHTLTPAIRLVPAGASATVIQAAIDSVYASGGGVIQLDSGTYTISSTITLKDGVSINGIRPKLGCPENCPDLEFTMTGGTILTGATGNEVIFSANTDAKPVTDSALSNVSITNLGFSNCAQAISIGAQDHLGTAFGEISNIFIDKTGCTDTSPAISLINPQHTYVRSIGIYNAKAGLLIEAFHGGCQPGNMVVEDVQVTLATAGSYGIALMALVSGDEQGPLNLVKLSHVQANYVNAGGLAAHFVFRGEACKFALASQTATTKTLVFNSTTDYSTRFNVGDNLQVIGTNAGYYTVASISYAATHTTVVVNEALAGDSAAPTTDFVIFHKSTGVGSDHIPVNACVFDDIIADGDNTPNPAIDADYVDNSRFMLNMCNATVDLQMDYCLYNSLTSHCSGNVLNYATTCYYNTITGLWGTPINTTYAPVGIYSVYASNNTNTVVNLGGVPTRGISGNTNTPLVSYKYTSDAGGIGSFAWSGTGYPRAKGEAWGSSGGYLIAFTSTTGGTNALATSGKASARPYETLILKKTGTGANAITIDFNGTAGDTLDGANTLTLTNANETVCIQSDGVSGWHTLWKNF